MLKIFLILLIPVLAAILAWSNRHHPAAFRLHPASIQDSITKYNLDQSKVNVIITKSSYILDLYIDGKLVKSYPVVFGTDPVNDKLCQGDGRTPEGDYRIRSKYPHKSWTYFLWIDYPNEAAWSRFNENKKKGLIAKDAKIGGEIGIHGVPFITSAFGSNPSDTTPHDEFLIDKKINWTAGCISLKTEDIKELYKYVPAGAGVRILH
jgi:murein L,D-transpeptidase YafK